MSSLIFRSISLQGSKLQLISPQCNKLITQRTCLRGFASTAVVQSYDVRRVEITPLEQRRLTFDTHALVQDLESHGFDKRQAETIVSALAMLTNASIDTVYRDMVTRAQQKMKIELDHVKQHLLNETNRIRGDTKLDINLERSRLTDLFTEHEQKRMEASTEFHKKNSTTDGVITEINRKIDLDIASLKTLMESHKLDTIRYLAGSVFACLAIALGFYRLWK
ncbi:coiled-coil domain-containing protein 90B, mitochondrial isoform X2 [Ascaphus truei]|uniref:coiled-coil domain-containing protein 90B, mitochondrial isoform X2 n=1 Tax=Ascaphus truei TaxID=8439 RepID=UPI003F59D0D3